eukprot:2013323-Prymnesium_polylepis.2
MDLVAGGELFEEIVARGTFAEPEARMLLRQLLAALAFCNEIGVVHRDLKPENILLDRGEDGALHLKLIDFGYAAILSPGERLTGLAGTPDYVAPCLLYTSDAADDM